MMVVVWLIGFAVGAANACVLQERGASGQQTGGVPQVDAHHAPMAQDQIGAVDHDCDAALDTAACKSLCELERGAPLKSKLVDADDLSAPAAFAALHLAGAERRPHAAWSVAPAPPPGPPVAILFLRLNL